MKANDFILLEKKDIYVVRRDKIEEQDYYSLFNDNGRQYGHEYADDYSIYNKYSGLYKKAISDGIKKFGKDFKRIRFWEDNYEIKILMFNELGLDASEQDVKDFLLGIEQEYAKYRTKSAITWFSGQRWHSVTIGEGLVPYNGDDKIEIINDYLKAVEESEKEYTHDEIAIIGDKYKFLEPRSGMFYEARIERVLVSLNPYTLKIKEDN